MLDNKKNQVIASYDNEKIKFIKKIFTSRKTREQNNVFAIEGVRLCYDAVISNINIHKTFYTQSAYNKFKKQLDAIIEVSEETYLVTENVAQRISETSTPQGVFCIAEMRKHSDTRVFDKNQKMVILENIQDPSNLGTILRSAEAFGIKNIVLSHDCVDVYSPKVLRGSMGAVFRVDFLVLQDLLSFVRELDIDSYATVPDKSAKKITEVDFKKGVAVVIGNEGRGISDSLKRLCCEKITIPMNGLAESLNAATAASIVMWEMVR